jgi:DNA-binding NarL/FixJ family response regulator
MAKTLGISEATVSDHVKSIMAKMNCHSRTQLLARVFGPS